MKRKDMCFIVNLDEQSNLIEVKTADENDATIIANGYFAFDEPDRTVLIIFQHVIIAPDNHRQLDQFLAFIIPYFGKLFKSFVCLRLPTIFDSQIDLNKLEFKNTISNLMLVSRDDFNYYHDNLSQNKQERYELIIDKQLILNYAQQLVKMMNREAFWSTNWDLKEMQNRIYSATKVAMILDKVNNHSCGFGRLFHLTTNDEIFGYLSDIVVDSFHQSKGLGSIIVSYLVGVSASQDDKLQKIHRTLCLQCADRGIGAVSAPKLYKRAGFEFMNDIGNHIAIFASKENYEKTFD